MGRPLPAEVAEKHQIGSGSGFFVGRSELVTNDHVIAGCAAVTVRTPRQGVWLAASVVTSDAGFDLAVLRVEGAADRAVTLLVGPVVSAPEHLTILGYPQLARLVVRPIMIQAAPEGDDLPSGRPWFRLRGLVRHGMSGSPVMDEEGRVLGVVARRLNPLARYRATGEVHDDDIGLAISSRVLAGFLQQHDVGFRAETAESASAHPEPLSVTDPQDYVAQVGCWK